MTVLYDYLSLQRHTEKLDALKLLSAKRNKFLRKRVQTHSKILWYHETIVPILSKWTSQQVVGLYVHLFRWSGAGQVYRTRYHGASPLSNWKFREETSTSGLILSPKFCFTVQALELYCDHKQSKGCMVPPKTAFTSQTFWFGMRRKKMS